jgi:hypothetical protein
MSKLNVDLDLVKSTTCRGRVTLPIRPPRSSPTNHLAGGGGQNRPGAGSLERGLSLYFHIPFCESLCWYCGCTTVITTQHEKGALYLQYLDKEMEQMSARINPSAKWCNCIGAAARRRFCRPTKFAGSANPSASISIARRTWKREWRLIRAG